MTLRNLVPWAKSKGAVPVRRTGEESPLFPLQRSIDDLFDRFLQETGWGGTEPGAFLPRVDVAETGDEIVVTADLPGLEQKDFDISLTGDRLVIRGEKKTEREEKGRHVYRLERSSGSFSRTIPLPCEVDEGKVEASYKRGVLKIRLPKAASAREKPKRIEVH